MTWAARYSRTDEPELTIYRDGGEFEWWLVDALTPATVAMIEVEMPDLAADIAARVPVRECIETQSCTRHAVDGERCWEHGGEDPL